MKTKVNVSGHPVHPMIVAFPITFYTLTPIAFGVYNWVSSNVFWYKLGYFCCFAGVATALLAAIPGFMDWFFGIPKNTAARKRGALHMTLNVSALVIFAVIAYSIYGTWNSAPASVAPTFVFSLIGVLITMTAGYHGWEMIARHKMGVMMTPAQEDLEPKEGGQRLGRGDSFRPQHV